LCRAFRLYWGELTVNWAERAMERLASRKRDENNPLTGKRSQLHFSHVVNAVSLACAVSPAPLLPELFHPNSSRLDASKLAEFFGLPVGAIAQAIHRRPEGVRKRPDSESLQPDLGRLYRIIAAVAELYNHDRKIARIFFNAPNRRLENKAPIEFIKAGELAVIESLIATMESRQPV
jgi:hypothetical protein